MASLLLLLCFLSVCAVPHGEEMRSQERLFLSSLGLSGRPRPVGSRQARRHVPSALWRMFRRSENIQAQDSDPCTVAEYGVRGNIIRYVQDQGRHVKAKYSTDNVEDETDQIKLSCLTTQGLK